MKKLILFGNSNFTKLMKWYIENDTNRSVDAVTVNERYIKEPLFCGVPVVPFEKIREIYSVESTEILICVGYSKMNTIREKIYRECKNYGYAIASFIHSSALISSEVDIGEGNIILEDSLIQPFVKIGNCNLLWYKISIAHDNVIGNFNTITGMASLCGNVQIGNNCFIGNNATIRDGVNISNFTLIGAGTYIDKSTNESDVLISPKAICLEKKSWEIEI